MVAVENESASEAVSTSEAMVEDEAVDEAVMARTRGGETLDARRVSRRLTLEAEGRRAPEVDTDGRRGPEEEADGRRGDVDELDESNRILGEGANVGVGGSSSTSQRRQDGARGEVSTVLVVGNGAGVTVDSTSPEKRPSCRFGERGDVEGTKTSSGAG